MAAPVFQIVVGQNEFGKPLSSTWKVCTILLPGVVAFKPTSSVTEPAMTTVLHFLYSVQLNGFMGWSSQIFCADSTEISGWPQSIASIISFARSLSLTREIDGRMEVSVLIIADQHSAMDDLRHDRYLSLRRFYDVLDNKQKSTLELYRCGHFRGYYGRVRPHDDDVQKLFLASSLL